MEELQSRFEKIKSSISIELNEDVTVSFSAPLNDENSERNINFKRRSLYSEIELFKMELEEFINVEECPSSNSTVNGGGNSIVKETIDKMAVKSHSIGCNNSPPRNVSNITSPLMNRLDVMSSSTSYVDGNRSGIKSKTTYNDIDSHGNNDRERLLNDQPSSNHGAKLGIHLDDDSIIESKSTEKSSYCIPLIDDLKKNDLLACNISRDSSSKRSDVRENVSCDILKIKQMIEECSSISGRFGLKFAHRNPHWCVTIN